MLDEETVEYGVCLILAGLVDHRLPIVWDEMFRWAKEPCLTLPYDDRMWIGGRAWMGLR